MVSSELSDALFHPADVLHDLYASSSSSSSFPSAVSSHFTSLFSTPTTFSQIPPLDVDHPPETHANGAIVRFRAMVQDTSLSPEMFLGEVNGKCAGWGLYESVEDDSDDAVDYERLRERAVVWAVSVPGESEWLRPSASSKKPSDSEKPGKKESSQSHKNPLGDTPHVGLRVKLYGTESESLRPTDIATLVGILSREPESALHVLFFVCSPPKDPEDTDRPTTEIIRGRLIEWLATSSLGGDDDAAEWVLLTLLGNVQSRTPPLLPPSLTLSSFPSPSPTSELANFALDRALHLLLPTYTHLPLSLPLLNETPFVPESKATDEEDLHAGRLQLPAGSCLLVSEHGIEEGKLEEKGVRNLQALNTVISAQIIDYVFPFSSFTFHTDIHTIVVTPSTNPTFVQTSTTVPLVTENAESLYADVTPPEAMPEFRKYVETLRSKKVVVGEVTSEHIQKDFVAERKINPKFTAEDLARRMTIARLISLSYGEETMSVQSWERAKALDTRREQRFGHSLPIKKD